MTLDRTVRCVRRFFAGNRRGYGEPFRAQRRAAEAALILVRVFYAANLYLVFRHLRLWPDWIWADQEIVGKVQRLGKPVWTTAGDAPREVLEELIRSGVNGILSDFPEVTSRLMADVDARRRGIQ